MIRCVPVSQVSQVIAAMTKAEKMAKDAPLKKGKIAEVPMVKEAKMKNDHAATDKVDKKAS
jgi:hypothetical protein